MVWSLIFVAVSWLLLSVLHELTLVLVARFLAWSASWSLLQQAVVVAPGDDIHAQLTLRMIGDLHGPRLALGVPGAGFLASHLSVFFASPELLPDNTWVGAVFRTSSSAVGIHVTHVLVNVIFVVFGVVLAAMAGRAYWPRPVSRWPRTAVALLSVGVLTQAYGTVSQLGLPWTEQTGGNIILSLVFTKIVALDGATYDALTREVGPLVSFAINLLILTGAFLVALGLRRALGAVPSLTLGFGQKRAFSLLVLPSRLPGPLVLFLAILLLQPAFKAPPSLDYALATNGPYVSAAMENPPVMPDNAGGSRPSVVSILPTSSGFSYYVNGVQKRIRGVGYNAITVGDSIEDRMARYDRDFALMRASGINTILGWDQREFDDILLARAAVHGLGVILPFDLQPSWSYEDSSVKAKLTQEIGTWVEHYKSNPALRMWGLGNEVIHGIGDVRKPRATAFARFLVETSDYIHKLDPDHPVVYRDAEDVYLEPVAQALARDKVSRPWFVYGMNFFSTRIEDAVKNGPTSKLRQPLILSEFGPAGATPPYRSAGYLKQWRLIRNFPQQVLGGFAYVWTTAGPEALDRSFGLTNEEGVPVDNSLFELSSAFLLEKASQESSLQGPSPLAEQPGEGNKPSAHLSGSPRE